MTAGQRLSPDQFPERAVDREPDVLKQWARDLPHQAAIQVAQARTAFDHPKMHMPLPEPNRWSRESRDAGMTLEHMLKTGGYPEEKATGAFVSLHRDPDARSSNAAYDTEGHVGAALHPDRWDYGTLAHEAAHHITQHQNGWAFHDHGLGDSDIHGRQFASNYAKTLGTISKGADEDFLRHHADAVQLVSNYRARVHGMSREQAEREAGE